MTGQEQANQAFISAMIPIALLFLVFIAIVWCGQAIGTPAVIEEIQEKETKEIVDNWPDKGARYMDLSQAQLSEVMQKVIEEQQKMLDEHAKKVCECEQE